MQVLKIIVLVKNVFQTVETSMNVFSWLNNTIMKKNKILIILLFCSSVAFAQSITVTGYGDTKDKALKSAFQNAVEQEVGVLVDTRTVIKNNKLIKNKILTYSNGFIKDYTEISSKEQLGFWTVKINAVVERQKLLSKIKKIKLKPKKITGTKKLYAQVVSQVKTKFDAEDLFKKFYKTFTSVPTENYSAEIKDFTIDSDLATRTTVPVKIIADVSYKQSDIVKKQLKEAFNLLEKLSIGNDFQVDRSIFERIRGKKERKHYPNEIRFIKNGTDIFFGFPRSYSVIYPFNQKTKIYMENIHNGTSNLIKGFGKEKRKRIGYIVVQALDKNGKILKSLAINKYKFSVTSMLSSLIINGQKLRFENDFDGVVNWDMPIKYLKKITQVKATIKWI